jgi:hypothetical protein
MAASFMAGGTMRYLDDVLLKFVTRQRASGDQRECSRHNQKT